MGGFYHVNKGSLKRMMGFRLPKRGRKGWQPETAMRVGCRGLPLLVVSGETLARAKR